MMNYSGGRYRLFILCSSKRSHSFAWRHSKLIYLFISKHSRSAAESWQPQQHFEYIIHWTVTGNYSRNFVHSGNAVRISNDVSTDLNKDTTYSVASKTTKCVAACRYRHLRKLIFHPDQNWKKPTPLHLCAAAHLRFYFIRNVTSFLMSNCTLNDRTNLNR